MTSKTAQDQQQHGPFATLFGLKYTTKEILTVPTAEYIVFYLLKCCSNCTEIPAPGSYSCRLGHVTCFECADKDLLCLYGNDNKIDDICGEKLELSPCHAFTSLLNATTIECPYDLCSMKLKGKDLQGHQLVCPGVARFKCLFTPCERGKEYDKITLLDHLLSKHCVPFLQIKQGIMVSHMIDRRSGLEYDVGSWLVAFMMKCKNTILICTYGREFVGGRRAFVIILYCLSTFTEDFATEYRGTILFSGGQNISQSYTGMLPNIMDTREDVIKSFRCLIIPDEIMLSDYGRIQVQVKGDLDEM